MPKPACGAYFGNRQDGGVQLEWDLHGTMRDSRGLLFGEQPAAAVSGINEQRVLVLGSAGSKSLSSCSLC